MLDAHGKHAFGAVGLQFSIKVHRLHLDGNRTLHAVITTRHRQTAFVADALFRAVPGDVGVDQPLVLINPEIVWYSPEKRIGDEGCLSVPGIYDGVERSIAIKVQALDLDGKLQTYSAEGMLAVCIQHEMDHLIGKVFVEYLSPLKRNRIKTKMIKQKKDEERESAI